MPCRPMRRFARALTTLPWPCNHDGLDIRSIQSDRYIRGRMGPGFTNRAKNKKFGCCPLSCTSLPLLQLLSACRPHPLLCSRNPHAGDIELLQRRPPTPRTASSTVAVACIGNENVRRVVSALEKVYGLPSKASLTRGRGMRACQALFLWNFSSGFCFVSCCPMMCASHVQWLWIGC